MKRKTFYFTDPVNDDFAGTNVKRKPLKDDFVYLSKNLFFKVFSFVTYRLIATPIVFLINKLFYHETIIGRKKLKKYRKNGYFLYANHVHVPADAYTPSLVTFPKKAYILVNPDATSIPVVSTFVKAFGGLPVPDSPKLYRAFKKSIDELAERKKVVTIYPEAHVWPYYTGIRPFKDASFKYPAEHDKPIFVFTRTIKKKKFSSRPKFVVYVDGPFFPEKENTVKQNQRLLRDAAYRAMLERSANSTYQVNEYVYLDDKNNEKVAV